MLEENVIAMIVKARELGVLEDIQSHLLPEDARTGTCTITCGDCDQFEDIYGHHSKKCCTDRNQVLSLNGGSLLCNPDRQEPMSIMTRGVYIHNIRQSHTKKKLTIVVFYAHGPCGAGEDFNLSVWDVLDHLVKAKIYMKNIALPDLGLKFMCFFHADMGSGKKRTYFVNPQKWEEHKETLKAMLD
jgi:hypothetical protein